MSDNLLNYTDPEGIICPKCGKRGAHVRYDTWINVVGDEGLAVACPRCGYQMRPMRCFTANETRPADPKANEAASVSGAGMAATPIPSNVNARTTESN